ncbi:hypothetical protein NX02_18605 [Sphingomonas sanxanigenens DSM 19645 = NX02]|uniref:Type VI secretion protein IcmF n=2 Tax=Sphingomonas sanxanigenens TaxID=397260 RepID=W0AIA3_9SPHN|nr:hypothetical protein NX02_18605 [Sphingomonas sanxanigenens DSM 19645 = NX02]
MKMLRSWWTLSALAAITAALVLAVLLPFLFLSLRPIWIRLLLVVLVAALWGAAAWWRLRRAARAADAIAAELGDPAGEEGDAVAGRMRDALVQLRTAAGGRRDYLYSRPWYVIVGPPGAGKTTAIAQSGLRFPLTDRALGGVGGTRNLDFWFADEAVLIDTAGRYTTQDSDEAVDAAGWRSFLAQLARLRPAQPVNGVLVAIGVDELAGGTLTSIDAHARAVCRRLEDIRNATQARVPIYLMLTKVDLLAGFEAFFDDLNADGRRAVLGATLPLAAGDAPVGATALLEQFDLLAAEIGARTAKRLQEEPDPARRGLILGFPAQVDALRARLHRFVEGALAPSADPRQVGIVRGFYLTSGIQHGTPLDRMLGSIAASYAAAAPVQPDASRAGRAYFINRLFTEVILSEPGLLRPDAAFIARRRGTLIAGAAALAILTLAGLGLLGTSYARNHALQTDLLGGAQAATQDARAAGIDLVEVGGSDPDLEQALTVLRALRGLPQGFADQRAGGPPLMMRWGLFQAGHAAAAEQAYLETTQRILLPRLLLQLERRLQQDAGQPLQLYEPLKVYLMLGGQGPRDARAIRAYLLDDWERSTLAGGDRADVRRQLAEHLDAMLADPRLGQVWREGRAPLDGALIARSRAALQTLSLSDRAYAILRQRAGAAARPDWTASTVLSAGDALAFANGEAVVALEVPWLFTREGYRLGYQRGLQTVQQDMRRDLWVFGRDADSQATRQGLAGLRDGVAALYARDYVAAWDKVATLPQPGNYFGDPAALGAFSKTPSALKLLLLEIRKNADLAIPAKGVKLPVGGRVAVAARLARQASGGGFDAGQTIQAHFRPIAEFVGDGRSPAPIDGFVDAVRRAASARSAADAVGAAGGGAVQGQLAGAVGDVVTSGAVAPPQLQPFVSEASRAGRGAAAKSAQGAIAEDYAATLLPACRAVVDDRYPFFGVAANDAPGAEMIRVFGASGQLDSFVTGRLAPLLDTAGPVWRWRADDPVAGRFDPASAERFQQAGSIRDLLSGGFTINVSDVVLGGGVDAAVFTSGGVKHRFERGSSGARPVIWTIDGLPTASVVLFSGKKEVFRRDAEGAWALFRLMDGAQKENAGETAIRATFGQGNAFATFRIQLPGRANPFGRGGLWSLRCPVRL